MQDHRDGADKPRNGQQMHLKSDFHEAASFQDGYFCSGDESQLEYALGPDQDHHGYDRNKVRYTAQPSRDHLSSSHNLWAPLNTHSETTSPTHLFNSSSLGVDSSEYWSSSLRDAKLPTSSYNVKHNRGPLDVQTSPISSPVSSSEDSIKPGLRDTTTGENQWKQAAQVHQYSSANSLHSLHLRRSDLRSADEEEDSHQQQMRASLDLANRLAGSHNDLSRAYSMAPETTSINAKMDPSSPWYPAQRGPIEGDSPYEAHIKSLAASTFSPSNESSQVRAYQLEQRAMEQFGMPNIDNTAEFSIFVGDLAPDLQEEDLVTQFLHPSAWPASHPFAIAHAHAQQAKGNYSSPAKVRPAPFTSTKSAKIMKDPLTGASRGFGFVRFSAEEDCARALVEMQGMVISPLNGPGRPLRVCTATPKNRAVAQSVPVSPWGGHSLTDTLGFYQQIQANHDRLTSPGTPQMHDQAVAAITASYGKPTVPSPFSPTSTSFYSQLTPTDNKSPVTANAMSYSNSALDPNNTTVFVGGLSSLISEDTLKTFFAPFGEIIYVKIPPGKGCGFVQFVKKMDAERAIERMQGFPIGGGRIRLSWGRSQGDKAAAAAAQVVAQSTQINQWASLASLSGMTPAQLNHLKAGLSNPANDMDGQFLRRLASLTASPTLDSREREAADLQRAASLQHLPALEQQHRRAQQQAGKGFGSPFDKISDPAGHFSSQWPDRDQRSIDYPKRSGNDDFLASSLSSLRLAELESKHLSAPQHSRSALTSSLSPDGRNCSHFLSPSGGNKASAFNSSSIFSPFSPPVSPSHFDDATSSHFNNSKDHRQQQHSNSSDNP